MGEQQPELAKQKRDLVLLAVRVGWTERDVCDAAGIDRDLYDAVLEADPKFAAEIEKAKDGAAQDEVMAASVVRNAARSNTTAAVALMRERAGQRELARIRELTTY